MNKQLTSLAVLTFSVSGLAGAQVTQPSLAASLPAGALMTLETHNAGPALDRISGVLARSVTTAMQAMSGEGTDSEDMDLDGEGTGSMTTMARSLLTDLLGREGVAGVFAVQGARGTFTPEVLAVARAGELSSSLLFGSARKPGARVGNYTFSRQGGVFVGQSGGLLYLSSDKALLMSYLGRLSGKAAPTLATSAPYATVTRSAGLQELSLYANFSAVAKVVRSQLTTAGLPRLLSPVVDALDTLGQYAGGLTSTADGLTTASAQQVNAVGKDAPLRRILSATTDFTVQDIIPASAENVRATACSPESGAYLGRWLTRLDLFEPFGFLTDSQLASHLEQSGRYLGGDCAQVTLAGGTLAGFDRSDPLSALRYSVSYQHVTDQAAAEAQMPQFAQSVNSAIAGLRATLNDTLPTLIGNGAKLPGRKSASAQALGMAAQESLQGSLTEFDRLLGHLKLVYGFRDGYLVTAYSDEALQAALAQTPDTLGQSDTFKAAGLALSGSAGWSYQPDLPEIDPAALLASLPETAGPDTEAQGRIAEMVRPVFGAITDLLNRYDGMTSQRMVQGNVIIGKANVRYRW